MERKIKWVLVNKKNFFLNYRKKYENSFYKIFKKKINWNVLLNLGSNKIYGVLGLNKRKEIIASSLLIPGSLEIESSEISRRKKKKYGLLINSFVFKEYSNGFSTYKKMIDRIKKISLKREYDLIIGFPNQNAIKLLLRVGKFEIYGRGNFSYVKSKSRLQKNSRKALAYFFNRNDLLNKIKNSVFFTDGNIIYKNYNNYREIFDYKYLTTIKPSNNMIKFFIWEKDKNKIKDLNINYLVNFCVFFTGEKFLIKKSPIFSEVFWKTTFNK